MRVLLTGSRGGIGSSIHKKLLADGHTVVAPSSSHLDLSESELSRHLNNGNLKQTVNSDKQTLDEIALLHEDYLLYTALTLL
jgi:nucleoside-diphosphate-sugar epimerase